MSSATAEERARRKAERKLEKQRQAAQHDLPRSMRPSAAVKTLTVVLLVLVLAINCLSGFIAGKLAKK